MTVMSYTNGTQHKTRILYRKMPFFVAFAVSFPKWCYLVDYWMASISIFKSIEFIFTFKPIVMQTTIMLCCGIILIGLNSHKQWRRKIIFMHNCCGHMNSLAVCIFIPSVHIEQSTAKYRWCGDHVDHVTVCPYIYFFLFIPMNICLCYVYTFINRRHSCQSTESPWQLLWWPYASRYPHLDLNTNLCAKFF